MSNEVIELLDDITHVDTILIDDDGANENLILSDVTYKEHKLFSEFVNKCLDLSDSNGMIRVFNKILLPAFKDLDQSYKESKRFEKILSRSLTLIETNPHHKFSCVKNLYETLKLHKTRKKVAFVTLTNNIKEKSANDTLKRKTDYIFNSNKKPAVTSCSDCDNGSVINLDKYDHDVVVIKNESAHTDVENNVMEPDKQTHDLIHTKENVISKYDKIIPNLVGAINDSNIDDIEQNANVEKAQCDNTLLMPKIVQVFHGSDAQDVVQKAQEIETKIALFKKKIAMLEELEVDDDSNTSPYILCERYKGMIVALYKEWCDLTGRESVKRSEVRLNVQDGHPPGPVQRLERLLNDNIGTSGHPPFPDFCDVVKCVISSNQEDRLGWNMSQMLREARALFTQCGRALQARRQKREWRFLMSRVKEEEYDKDPAINNPELEARLQANRDIALKKEADILDRFAKIESLPPKANNETGERANQDLENQSSDNCTDVLEDLIVLNENINFDSAIANDVLKVEVKKEPEDIAPHGKSCATTIQYIEDPSLVIEISSDSSSDED